MWHAICNTVKSASKRLIMKDVYLSRRRCLQVSAFVYSLSAPLLPFGRSFWQCRLCRVVHPEESIKGVAVLKEIESLWARDAVDDEVKNFEAGANNYLTKTFKFPELLVRIKALLRRGQTNHSNAIRVAGLEIDRINHQCFCRFLITLTKRLQLPKGVAQKLRMNTRS